MRSITTGKHQPEGEGSRRSGLELTLDHRAGEVRLRQRGEEEEERSETPGVSKEILKLSLEDETPNEQDCGS